MISINVPSTISFNVQVHGTSSDAEARLVLTANDVGYIFKAQRTTPNSFEASVCVPACVQPGQYPMAVEVIVNGRLFTPLRRMVEVDSGVTTVEVPAIQVVQTTAADSYEIQAAPVPEEVVEPVAPQTEVQQPAPQVEVEAPVQVAQAEVKQEAVPAEKPAKKPRGSLLKLFAEENPPPVIEVPEEVQAAPTKVSVPLIRLSKDKVIFEE